jgi:hypothetical protein
MDSAQLKRMILDSSESSGIRKKLTETPQPGITTDDIVEMGQAIEQTVATKGWAFIDSYLVKKCDPNVLLFGDDDPLIKGEARGAIHLMQYIDQVIKAKNEILRRANEPRPTSAEPTKRRGRPKRDS